MMCIGCGSGNYTVALSEYVGKVTGLEVNEGMLGRAMEKTAALKNVSLTQGDITKMPFQDSQFDGICCNQVNHSYAVILCSLIYMPNPSSSISTAFASSPGPFQVFNVARFLYNIGKL